MISGVRNRLLDAGGKRALVEGRCCGRSGLTGQALASHLDDAQAEAIALDHDLAARNALAVDHHVEKFVGQLTERVALIIDPMLATGGSMVATCEMLKRNGCAHIKALVLVAAPEGIAAMQAAHPDVQIYAASIDSHLNEVGYIIPGLGDAGDKIFGTKHG